ncbi:response regulator transcription factor [Paraburkholderia sediminicola]|uniref:response regulator transcription factor n=1 Tax=Paraburkholderia sediminicola TaxID=458836 RepID=UPI0038BA935E
MKVLAYLETADSASGISVAFATLGHSFEAFGTSDGLLAQLRQVDADLVLIGWSTEDMGGLDVLRWIRKNCPTDVAVAFLSVNAASADVALALQSGADDYFVAPMEFQALMARCEALIRRVSPARLYAAESYRVASYTLNARMQTVSIEGTVIPLTPQEMQLALLFFRNLSKPLSREYIRETVWGAHAQIAARAIDTQLSRLRSKLMLYRENGLRLRPLYRQGYVLEPWGDELSADPVPHMLQKSDSNVSRT